MKLAAQLLALLAMFWAGCGLRPEDVAIDDPRVIPLLEARKQSVYAAKYFSPITVSRARLETRPRAGYDAMLHVRGETNRTIAFKKEKGGCKWIGEQEIHNGVREYDTVDGRIREQLSFTYELLPLSGVPLGELCIVYRGGDARLSSTHRMSLQRARLLLAEWKTAPGHRP